MSPPISSVRKVTGLPAACFDDIAIERFLLFRLRHGRGDHELQLGAEQADALGARFRKLRQIDQQAGIHLQLDALAILGHRLDGAQRPELFLPPGAEADLFLIGPLQVGHRPQMHIAPRRRR